MILRTCPCRGRCTAARSAPLRPGVRHINRTMKSKTPIHGNCHLCGRYRQLTYEHIPPQAAFNNHTILYDDIVKLLTNGFDQPFTGKQQQGGIGRYTLCSDCNSFTGREYGAPYVSWCMQGMEVLHRTASNPFIDMPFHIFPLRVLKQIVSMFLSVNGIGWRNANMDLVEFVYLPKRKYLSRKYSVYAFYSVSAIQRQSGTAIRFCTNERFENLGMDAFSEITFPPFGYVMTVDNDAHDSRLVDISYFANRAENELRMEYLKLPVLPIFTSYPGDYRTKEEIEEDIRTNERRDRERANQSL